MNRSTVVMTVVLAIAALELVASARAYRTVVDEDDWATVVEATSSLPTDEPIFLAEAWLGPRARQMIPAVATWTSATRPDLRGLARFHVLGLDASWSEWLERDREDLKRPQVEATAELGPFTLTTYTQDQARAVLDLTRSLDALTVAVVGRNCPRTGQTFRCQNGSVKLRTAEIDYRARRCLEIDASDGQPVTLTTSVAEPGRLIGHVGFHDFNARLRSDVPIRLEIVDSQGLRRREIVTDPQGWWTFEVDAVAPGPLVITVVNPVSGTWQRHGLDRRHPHAPCLEVRVFPAEAPS